MARTLAPGKLPFDVMERLLSKYYHDRLPSSRVKIGPHLGQDVAVLDMGDRYLVSKTDPVTFATDEIGYYAVHINANDIATSGAKPRWFQTTILLPEKGTTEEMLDKIFGDIAGECHKLGIEVIGGHTEVTFGLDRPLIIGAMWGDIAKDRLVTTMGGKPGDALLITKGIVLEGAAIIAHEKEAELLAKGIDPEIIARGKRFLHDPGISVVPEALLIHEKFSVHAMHDPTEGGLAMGVVEMVANSNCGVVLDYDKIPFLEGSKELCAAYSLDPLSTITSGVLILAVPAEEVSDIITYMKTKGIAVAKIGELTDQPGIYQIKDKNGTLQPLVHSQTDEITKIF